MDKKHSLVFFGNEVLATGVSSSAPIFSSLIDAGYDIKAVVMSRGKVTSRNFSEPQVQKIGAENNIPVIDDLEDIANIEADAAVLVAYGQILPSSVIKHFPAGIINVHPSLLPKYRGPTPIEQTILDNPAETGVSLIKLIDKTDAGPVYAQVQKVLHGDETKQQLADELGVMATKLLTDSIEAILSGEMQPADQDEATASHTNRLTKADGQFDWSKTADRLEREVRAYAGWPKSRANIHKHDVILTKVRVAKNETDGELMQKTGDGWLEIQELIAPSGRSMSGSDFLRGYAK